MWMKQVIAAVIISVIGASIANADLILTVDGQNPSGFPLMLQGIDPYQIALGGNTVIELNDVRLEAVGGTVTVISDVNHQYSFQYETGSTAGLIWLISGTEIILDGITVPAETTIYEVFIFDNPDANLTGVCGSDYGTLNPPPEEEDSASSPQEEGGEGDSIAEEPGVPTGEIVEEIQNETPHQQTNDTNSFPPTPIRQERQPVLAYCPNVIEEKSYFRSNEECESLSMADDGGGRLLLDGAIEVSSDITTNQIWTANNVYNIIDCVNVQALLVIEPGTIITFAHGTCMNVNNGGTLISSGAPDNPIIYTCDFLYPDWGTYWQYISNGSGSHYLSAIYIEETASPATTVTYCFIEGAFAGVVTKNIKLDHPIENNYLIGNIYGIGMYGPRHTDIINNLCYFNDISGIDVYLGDENDIGDAGSIVNISNNTCDTYQNYGITIHGVDNEEGRGLAVLSNNIVTFSYVTGIRLVDGCISWIISNTGYYGNASNRSGYTSSQEYYPVYAIQNPYVEGSELNTFLALKPDCNFINTGNKYIDKTSLIGKTTDANGIPDNNKVDLGFHYMNWGYSNAGDSNNLMMDLFDDSIVNFKDLSVLASGWQTTYDISDLIFMADEWLSQGDPNIQIQFNGDPNNGYVDIGLTGQSSDTLRIFILANGHIIGGTFGYKDDLIRIDISKFGNGVHNFKVVSVDSNSHITCSNITDVNFSRTLYYCVLPKTYERNQPLPFAAYNSGTGNVTVKAYANGESLVWSQTYTENDIYDSIPASITNQYEFDYVSFDNDSGQSLAKKVTDPNLPNFSENVQALIVLPKWWIRVHDYQIVWAVKHAFEHHGIIYATLSGSNATYENMLKYAREKHIKYLYIGCTDGHYLLLPTERGGVDDPDNRRTCFHLYDPQGGDEIYEDIVSIQREDYSDPNMAPSWCVDLWMRGLNSVATIGFTELQFAYIDFCYSGRLKINGSNQLVQGQSGQQGLFDIPHSDMSFALGMAGSGRSNFYQGWYDKARSKIPPLGETEYQRWSRIEWYRLETGMDLYDTLLYVISQQYYFGPLDPVNCYRLKGEGFIEDIELSN